MTYDDDAFNAAVVTVLGDQPFGIMRDMLLRTHQHFAQLLSTLEDTSFVPGNNVYERVKVQISHNDEHAQQLDERR